MAPVAFVERRVAQHGVGGETPERVVPEGVPGGDLDARGAGIGAQDKPERGERGEFRRGLLGEERAGAGDGAQQRARAGRGVEDGDAAGGSVVRGIAGTGGRGACGRVGADAGERGHQGRGVGGGECVLPGVGVQVAAEQELEGLRGAEFTGEFRGTPQQGDAWP